MNEDAPHHALDRQFARLMVKLNGAPSRALEFAAQTVSARRGDGHTCVHLSEFDDQDLITELRKSKVVGRPGEAKPLILDAAGRLYLQRYWAYENAIARNLQRRMSAVAAHDANLLAMGLARYFPDGDEGNDQRLAAAMSVEKQFAVITGGPGTGKTRTVVVVLALIIEQWLAQGRPPRIAMTAPTGKASARMKESLQNSLASLALPDEVRAAMPQDALTLHRLLGTIPGSPYFRHNTERPLALDVVIVDEASMVDLALMAKLLDALPNEARLILLGDKDQLASVEAGYVLGDICHTPGPDQAPIRKHIVELKKNYRFGNESGIYQLSGLVNAGFSAAALQLLKSGSCPDIAFFPLPHHTALWGSLRSRVIQGYRAYLEAANPREALARLNDFRILSTLRLGPFGVENLNRLVEEILADAGWIDPVTPFYCGRPIVIRQNDEQLKLFNGDVGVLLPDPEEESRICAFFVDAEGTLRRLLPARLPAHETVFAMTVHKSQGSEFSRVLLVLPDHENRVASRELVYTGITRARTGVELWATESALVQAIARRTSRTSGLSEALWSMREDLFEWAARSASPKRRTRK